MADKATRKNISGLLRKDYPYPVLQELIAEIILNTGVGRKDGQKRFDSVCKAIFRNIHEDEKKKSKYSSDYYRVLAIMNQYPKLTLRKACEELARLDLIPGYKIGTKGLKLSSTKNALINAKTLGLHRGLKDKNLSPRHFIGPQFEKIFEAEHIYSEAQSVKRMMSLWIEKYSTVSVEPLQIDDLPGDT